MQTELHNWIHRDVWVGQVRTANETDLVYAQLGKSDTGVVVASYKIGFDLSPISGKPMQWSKQYRIPGEFSTTTRSFSISVFDIDDNRKPDIVIYLQIVSPRSPLQYRFKYAFVRVGKDLDDTGRVTNGWTRFKRVPYKRKMNMGVIDTTTDMNDFSPPVLIAVTR